MTAFQWIAVPILALLFVVDLVRVLFLRPMFRSDRLLRAMVWLAAAVAIWWPELTVYLANAVGIQRGADLVLYLFVLVFLGAGFYFYSQSVRLERQLTDVVRHVAINEAKKQGGGPVGTP